MESQHSLPATDLNQKVEDLVFDLPQPEPIKGFPELRWNGKRPFRQTHYYPAVLKESYGDPVDGWYNRLYWGDNLQVMSHLLKEFRGKVDLVYIDPPFDSKAEYKKTISINGTTGESDLSNFEEKQYSDIWINDEYLQFIYERLIVMKYLLSASGSIYIHCDRRLSPQIKLICDEILGVNNYKSWICWKSSPGHSDHELFGNMQNHILFYSSGSSPIWNQQFSEYSPEYLSTHYQKIDDNNKRFEDDNLTAYGLSGGGYEYEWNGHTRVHLKIKFKNIIEQASWIIER